MEFIHITGYSASGKTTIELNERYKFCCLWSEDEFPNKDGICFINSVLYKAKPRKKGVIIDENKIDWFGRHRRPYYELLLLEKKEIHTIITSSLDLPFNKRDIELALNEGHRCSS